MWLVHAFISLPKQALLALSPSFSLSSLRSVSSPKPSNKYGCTGAPSRPPPHAPSSFPQQQRQPPPTTKKKFKGRRGTEPPRVVHLNNPRLLSWCRQPRLATNQPNQLATQLHFLHSFLLSTLTHRVNVEARGHRVVLAAHPTRLI